MRSDTALTLHRRDDPDRPRALVSRDDVRFLATAPMLVTAAALAAPSGWNRWARGIDRIGRPFGASTSTGSALAGVARALGVTEADLKRTMEASRILRTENLILVLHSLMHRRWKPDCEIVGRSRLEGALAGGGGAVLWVGHFAFASLVTKMVLGGAGHEVAHVSRPEHGVSKSHLGIHVLNRFRCTAENRHLARRIVHVRSDREPTRAAALDALASNQALSITAGAWEGRHMATGPFLGSRLTLSTGAPALAFAGGAPLLPVFTTRTADGLRFRTVIGAPVGEPDRTSVGGYVKAAVAGFLSQYDSAIRQAPDQWRGWGALTAPTLTERP